MHLCILESGFQDIKPEVVGNWDSPWKGILLEYMAGGLVGLPGPTKRTSKRLGMSVSGEEAHGWAYVGRHDQRAYTTENLVTNS